MGPLAIIIVLELVLSTSILGLSSYPQTLNKAKHKISNVLGVEKSAQVDDNANSSSTPADNSSVETSSQTNDSTATPPPAESTNAPEPSSTSSPQEPSLTTPVPEPSNLPSVTNQNSEAPIDTPLFEQKINPSPTGESQGSTTNPQPGEKPPSNNRSENVTQTQAVLNPDDLITSSDNINIQSVTEAKKEDEQLNQISDPKEQTQTLITFATDKVRDMSSFSKSDDFSSTNFAASRFNEQIDKAINNLDKLPKQDQVKLRQQLVSFCSQADQVLRTVELSVPQKSEQDIQMARGQCQELQL